MHRYLEMYDSPTAPVRHPYTPSRAGVINYSLYCYSQ